MSTRGKKNLITLKDVVKYYYWRVYGWRKYSVLKPRKPVLREFYLLLPNTERLLRKALFVLLIFCLNFYGIQSISGTVSYFSDLEISGKNVIEAGVLDMEVEGEQLFLENFEYGFIATSSFTVTDVGSVEFLHGFTSLGFGDLCEYLVMDVLYDGDDSWDVENVPLLDFDSGLNFEPGNWELHISLPEENEDKEGDCVFDINFEARQLEVEEYWDEEVFENLIGTSIESDFSSRAMSFEVMSLTFPVEEFASSTESEEPEGIASSSSEASKELATTTPEFAATSTEEMASSSEEVSGEEKEEKTEEEFDYSFEDTASSSDEIASSTESEVEEEEKEESEEQMPEVASSSEEYVEPGQTEESPGTAQTEETGEEGIEGSEPGVESKDAESQDPVPESGEKEAEPENIPEENSNTSSSEGGEEGGEDEAGVGGEEEKQEERGAEEENVVVSDVE